MKLKLAISPCPNDTFIFEGLIQKQIPLDGLTFEVQYKDIEELNTLAQNQACEVVKISVANYLHIHKNYKLLNAGAALGRNCGPLLIASKKTNLDSIEGTTIAIPGFNTTAYLLLKMLLGKKKFTPVEMIFSDIEKAVADEKVDLGLIIHESRFVYEQKGLKKVIDLGEYWENKTGLPIPLGVIAITKTLSQAAQKQIETAIKNSIEYAQNNTNISEFIKHYAQETEPSVIRQHIELYVNDESVALSLKGKQSILELLNQSQQNQFNEEIFISLSVN